MDQGVTPQRQHQAHCTSATVVRKRRSAHLLQHHAIILISQQWLQVFALIRNKNEKIPLLLQRQTEPVSFYRCLARIINQIQGTLSSKLKGLTYSHEKSKQDSEATSFCGRSEGAQSLQSAQGFLYRLVPLRLKWFGSSSDFAIHRFVFLFAPQPQLLGTGISLV